MKVETSNVSDLLMNPLLTTNSQGFFHFSQNNSGGSFDINDRVTVSVYIEALNADDANDRAERIGIYFNGCSTGQDCSCCGDRWYSAYGSPAFTNLQEIINQYDEMENGKDSWRKRSQWADDNEPFVIIYSLDGTVTKLVKG